MTQERRSPGDFMVTQHCCHDDSFVQSLEDGERIASWKIEARGLQEPIEIEIHVSKTKAGVKINGAKVLPRSGAENRCSLDDDFVYEWPSLLGNIRGLHEERFYEVQPNMGCAGNTWYPATLTRVREDGDFDVIAMVPAVDSAGGGERRVAHPSVGSDQIRAANTRQPPERLRYTVVLRLPQQDPRNAEILLDTLPVTRCFSRPTPAGTGPLTRESVLPKVRLQVNKTRSTVTADVGHVILGHFLSNEPRNIAARGERLRKTWKLQIGPFSEHSIVLEKRFVSTDIVTLSIDRSEDVV